MSKHYLKLTDPEWLELLTEYSESGLTASAWCRQKGITNKSFYYHRRYLRKKGFSIPQRSVPAQTEKQEVVCIDFLNPASTTSSLADIPGNEAVIRVSFMGMSLEITNQAAPDIITNTFRALLTQC